MIEKAGISSPPKNGIFVSLFGLKDFTHFNLSFHLIFCGPHRCLGLPELPKPRVVGIACGALGQVGWAARRPWAPLLVQGTVVVLLAFPLAMPGAQAVVLVPPCLFLPSSQGFFTVIASELLFSFKPLFSPWKAGLWLLSSRGDSLQPEARDWQVPPGNQGLFSPGLILVLTLVIFGALVLGGRRWRSEFRWNGGLCSTASIWKRGCSH